MKKYLLIVIMVCSNAFLIAQTNINVKFNKNIEFFGYIIHLAEPSVIDETHPIKIILDQYQDNQNNATLHQIFNEGSHLTYAFYVDLFYSLPELPLKKQNDLLQILREAYPNKSKDEINQLERIISLANKFYGESNFESIWMALDQFRSETVVNLNERLPSNDLMFAIESFYEQRFMKYSIVPSLTIWPTAGWGFEDSENAKASFILGPLDEDFNFNDTEKFRNLAIHEFGHSFVNKVVLKNKQLIEETEALYPTLSKQMTKQGYIDWESCIIEHFVRAGEIIIPESINEDYNTTNLLNDYVNKKYFVYLPFIIKRLKFYRFEKKFTYSASVTATLSELKEKFL